MTRAGTVENFDAPSRFLLATADALRSILILILQTGKLRLSEKSLGRSHPAGKR